MPDTTNPDVIAKVTCHNNVLVIEGPAPDFKHADWVPVGPGKIGCVLMDTAKHLGVSEEALKKVRRSRDDIGDVDWFASHNNGHCFAWLGGLKAIFGEGAEGSRTYAVPEPGGYVVIPNDVPEEARRIIDERGAQ